jgi:phosphoribosylformylglycinamidine cyclo-ligase
MGQTYQGAGVDIAAGERAVAGIKEMVRSTFRPEVIGDVGGFGGLFDAGRLPQRSPVLVASTDGVGTKSAVARLTNRHRTIGLDVVAMSVDDVAANGAEPLFFLDYISSGHLVPEIVDDIVAGVAEGCRKAGCALLGGEMSEHPGQFPPGEFDLVGFAVGVAERDQLITGEHVGPGDVLIGLPSPGLRSNGYSLARKVLLEDAGRTLDDAAWSGAHHSLGDELLVPSVVYAPAVAALLRHVDVRSLAHITGGGLPGNLARVLPDDGDAVIDQRSWEPPRIFGEIQRLGDVTDDEMRRVFNMGIGMVAIVDASEAHRTLDILRTEGHRAALIGEIERGAGKVRFA